MITVGTDNHNGRCYRASVTKPGHANTRMKRHINPLIYLQKIVSRIRWQKPTRHWLLKDLMRSLTILHNSINVINITEKKQKKNYSVNKDNARGMPHTGQLNEQTNKESTHTIKQRENRTSNICEHNSQTQNQETVVTIRSMRRIQETRQTLLSLGHQNILLLNNIQ